MGVFYYDMRLADHLLLLARSHKPPEVGHDLAEILRAVVQAGRKVQDILTTAALTNNFAPSGKINVQGEVQQKMDVVAHDTFAEAFSLRGMIHTMISEEVEAPLSLSSTGRYMVALDPVDGSSNLDVNIPTGTIFSIHAHPHGGKSLPQGSQQLLAGYLLYGTSTMLLYAHRAMGVHGFTYHPEKDDFFLSHQSIRTANYGQTYSINEGATMGFAEGIMAYLQQVKAKKLSSRYVGSLVADFHRNLLKGGIFIYPATNTNPNGKVRLLYEASPLAFIVTLAGGRAVDEKGKDILAITPNNIHERTSLCIGSQDMVEEFMRCSR